jgi:glycosyltransferase involved in cell wall biosynthesis
VKSDLETIGKLSVVIPCFNEEKTIFDLLNRVLSQEVVGEVIVVDDGSSDHSGFEIMKIQDPRVIFLTNTKNLGKGKSIWRGIQNSTMEFVVIQDADLEYDPKDYQKMLYTIIQNSAGAVYGSRFLASESRRALYFWHSVGNRLLTLFSNIFTNIYLTDMETCYKLMRTDIAKKLDLKENRFGIEPEITAKLAKMRVTIYEVPIKYDARTYQEGKKIGWKDGFRAIYCIVKYSI